MPYAFLDSYDETITLDEIPITEGLEDLSEYIISVDYLRIKSGELTLEVDNQFPFDIAMLEISFNDENNEDWETLALENISSGNSDLVTADLMQSPDVEDEARQLPSTIMPGNSIVINDDGSDVPNGECKIYIPSDSPSNPIEEIDICFDDCLSQPIPIDEVSCPILDGVWDAGTCMAPMTEDYCNLIDPENDGLDSDTFGEIDNEYGVETDDFRVIWNDGGINGNADACWFYLPGWITSPDDQLSIDISFDNIEMHDMVGHLAYESETTTTQSITVDESISLVSAHIEDISHSDTNKIIMNIENELFTPVDIELSIENILNEHGQPFVYQTTIDKGSSLNTESDEPIDLSDHEIRNPNPGFLEELVINNKISFDSENTQIEFGKEYKLDIIEISTTPMKFDELYVYLKDFTTPPIDMASVPAGFGNIGLPTLQFNLFIYNEIDAPLTLNLDLRGVTDGANPIEIHVEPELKFPNGYDGIDTTIISIYSDTLEVQGKNFTDYYQLEARIETLFSRDEIEVSGNAVLNGESSLQPGKSFWGDVAIEVRPLTIVFPEDITFSPQENTQLSLDQNTRENIEDGLIEAELFIEVGNSMPIGATLNMLTSDKSFFPLCFDTLVTGNIDIQTVSDTCLTLIEEWYNPDSIYVNHEESGENIYTEFINSSSSDSSAFIGKLITLDLGIPTDLDENGFIMNKAVTYNNILLDTTRMKWLTSNDLLYIAPIINNVRTSIDTLPGYVTFHTIDYLQIRSFLTLVMDSQIITGSEDAEE